MQLIANDYAVDLNMMAKNGATIMPGSNRILTQINKAPAQEPDIVVFEGYTNDCYGSAESDTEFNPTGANPDVTQHYGEISAAGTITFDNTTFCGAFEETISAIKTKWPNSKVVFVTIHKSGAGNLEIQQKLRELSMQACEKWGIDRPYQLPLESAKSSGGIWAPTIRYNNGKFYVTATYDGRGNFIISSKDPSKDWSEAVWVNFEGIDPSIFFENGKAYYCANDIGSRAKRYGSEGVSLAEINPETGEIIGDIQRIWSGAGGGWLEAPHIYHIGGYYYIIAAEGGTGNNHHEIAARSNSIFGPYENCPYNPILTNMNDTTRQISCSGHADLVDDKNGNWWIVHLGTRDIQGMTHLGRETFLTPVKWKNGWFYAHNDRKAHIEADVPLWNGQKNEPEWEADFCKTVFDKRWLWRRAPDKYSYRLSDGVLTIKPARVKLCDYSGSPSFMAVRPIDIKYSITAEFDFSTEADGDAAGIVVFLDESFYYRAYKKHKDGRDYMIFEKQIADINSVSFREEIGSGRLKVRIVMDGYNYHFRYSLNNDDFIDMGTGSAKLLSTNLAGKCFTGSVAGVFAECDRQTEAEMKLFRFCMKADLDKKR